MKRIALSLLVVLTTLCGFVSCDTDEKFTTDRSAFLSFNPVVKFDTVVTAVGSSTKRLTLYNNNGKGLRISSVRLLKGATSGFRVNVDGENLGVSTGFQTSDLEVAGGDSLLAFVEVTPPAGDNDTPQLLADDLEFVLESGLRQVVHLEAYGQDVYVLRGRTLSQDTVLKAGRPVVVYDSLVVPKDRTLELEAGVRLYFHGESELLVYGRVEARGTLEKPVELRTDRTDRMFTYLPYDRIPGRWGGVRLKTGSYGNVLEHCYIHGGNYGVFCEKDDTTQLKLTLNRSIIHNVKGHALALEGVKAVVANCQLTNSEKATVVVWGGVLDMVHCTVAQFYPMSGSTGDAVRLYNYKTYKTEPEKQPLYRAHFYNCYFTGRNSDVVFPTGVAEDDCVFNYCFYNCLLATPEVQQEKGLKEVRFEDKNAVCYLGSNFVLIDTHQMLFDFRLNEGSKAVNCGSPLWLDLRLDTPENLQLELDFNGLSHRLDEAPDAGCYEWQTAERKETE